MKKQDLVKSIVEILKTRSTVAMIDCKNMALEALKEREGRA